MSTLVSPGVDVTINDQSFYIPSSAPTVPLIFIATRASKLQTDGVSSATGTTETGVVRTVTSIGQSAQLYGVPYFITDSSGNAFNGDARNEYGLFALNQYLNQGNLAYVVRANVDLTDAASSFIGIGTPVADTPTFTGVGNGTISSITASSAFVQPETVDVVFNTSTTFTVQGSTSGIIGTGTVGTAFTSNKVNFTVTAGSTAFSGDDYFQFDLVYAPTSYSGTGNGTMSSLTPGTNAIAETWTVLMTSATTFSVTGSVTGPMSSGVVGSAYSNNYINFTITSGSVAFVSGDQFTVVLSQVNLYNPLGANDAAKRVTITTALKSEINSNTDVRSETYKYNLILAPGYWECIGELLSLSTDVNGEAFVIADTPSTYTPEQVVSWASTTSRHHSTSVAYYYPWGQASNLDGATVVCAASGIALATYAYSDNVSYVWFAPAGVRRGTVSSVDSVGYVSGSVGTAADYTQINLNQGQRDNMYQSYTNLNPIVNFPSQGLLVWGQKTSASASSALDRVNVVRMLMYLKRQLRTGAMSYVFEPNDAITRKDLKASADAILNDIMSKRGLYDFVTQCDTSNNTSDIIDNNELYMDVGIKPTKAAEFIYIPITVYTTGATLP